MSGPSRVSPRRVCASVGVLASAVLLYTVVEQVVDHNFQVLWEVTNIFAGDRPYRDFFVTGWPLETALSAAVQWLVGYRLIGEYLTHWIFLVAAVVMGFHLALRLSRSMAASLAVVPVTLLSLPPTATVHFPKLFFYPLAVLVLWRYLEHPRPRVAALAGAVTAIAFLFRHDHGVYLGVAFVAAFALARAAVPSSRRLPAMVGEASAYAAAAGMLLLPWAALVHLNEGLPDFVRTRAEWGAVWAPPPGSPFDVLREIDPRRVVQGIGPASWRPDASDALVWLVQVTLLLPMLVLASVAADLLRRRHGPRLTPHACATMLTAGLSLFVMSRLGREESYYVVVLPLSMALGARLLAGGASGLAAAGREVPVTRTTRGWRIARTAVAVGVLGITTLAALGRIDPDFFSPNQPDEVRLTYRLLLSSPPIDAYQPAAEAHEMDWAAWQESNADARQKLMMRYMHDCTRDGDRLLVTGSTPYHVGYFVERPLAGGQMQWHHRWRASPPDELQAFALIERHPVPFAFSTHDPVLDDFTAYPRIHAYLQEHYVHVEGAHGLLLVDKRRQPTGRFGSLGWPCFR